MRLAQDVLLWEEEGRTFRLEGHLTQGEAVDIANSTEYGLQSGVMTSNLENIRYCINNLKVGAVNINEGPQFDMPNIPFGGVKRSGFGRELGLHALEGYSEIKSVFISTEG